MHSSIKIDQAGDAVMYVNVLVSCKHEELIQELVVATFLVRACLHEDSISYQVSFRLRTLGCRGQSTGRGPRRIPQDTHLN